MLVLDQEKHIFLGLTRLKIHVFQYNHSLLKKIYS